MKSPVINELAHALTNFSEFPGNIIVADSKFTPKEQSSEWTTLRSSLFLDNINTDQYIHIAISLMSSSPNVIGAYPNNKLEFNTHRPNEDIIIDEGEFVTVGSRIGGISTCGVMPIPSEYKIKYDTDKSITISTDTGKKFVVKSTSFEYPKGGSVLAVDWPAKLPFTGPLRTFDPWNEASRINISFAPVSIDYKDWLSHIELKSDPSDILIPSGLAEEYTTSQSVTEKLAIMLLALAKSNKSINYDGRHRY